MGSSQKDPRNPETTATKERPENKAEVPKGQKTDSLEDLKKKAEKLKSDPSKKAAEAIRKLKGDLETVKQLEGLTALNQALVSVLTKLAKDGADIAKIKTTKALELAVTTSGIKLSLPEATAVENLDNIASKSGPTATEIKNSWPDRIKAAQEGSKGWGEKYKEHLEKDPTATIALTVAGAAGIYLTFQWLTTIAKRSAAGAKAGEDRETSWSKREIMIPLGIMAAGFVLGKDRLKKLLAECGIDYFKVADKIKKGEEFTDDEKKKLKKGGKKVQKKIEELKEELKMQEDEEPSPVPGALETEEDKLREFGESLLVEKNGAEELVGGIYFIMTGERKTYFRFNEDEGRWEWASEWQKRDDKWAEVGTSMYGNKKKFVKVNGISERLAIGLAAMDSEEDEEARKGGKTSELTERGAEALKIGRYPTAKKIFLALYFNPRYADPATFDETIDNISQVKFKKIRDLVDQHKAKGKIPKTELPSIKSDSDITEEQLFKLLNHMVGFSKFGHVAKGLTVQAMFEAVADNPLSDQLGGMNQMIMDALKDGSVEDALKSLSKQSAEMVSKQAKEMVERLDNILGIDVNQLSKDELEVYRQIQVLLMTNRTLVKREPKEAIERILATNTKFKEHPKAVTLATKFYTEVKKLAPGILERVVKKFEIEKDGTPNYLRDGVNMDNFRFFNACELVLLDKATEGKGNQATDLVVLGVLIKSFTKPYLREPYIGLISNEITKDIPSINIPGLKVLQPYFERAAKTAGSYVGYKALDYFNRAKPYQTLHPTAAKDHEAMAEEFKNQNIGFGILKEGVGTGLELTSDALAAIVLALPGVQDGLASCDTGKEFLDLIRVHGGHTTAYKDRDGALGILIDTGYEVFLARPSAIVWESAASACELSWGGAWDSAKIWIGGSSFFVAANAIRGVFKAAPAADGSGGTKYTIRSQVKNAFKYGSRGLYYPIKAPYMAYKAATQTARGLATGYEGIKSMAKTPVRGGRRVLNWSRDVIRNRTLLPGQNMENMVDTGRLLEYHFKSAKKKGGFRTKADIRAGAERLWRTGKDFVARPGTTFKQITAGDWHWGMTEKYAKRLASQHNDFFKFAESHTLGFELDELKTSGKIKDVIAANKRLTTFFEAVKKDPKVLERIREAGKELKSAALEKEVSTILNEMKVKGGLASEEIEFLAKRIKNEKTAKRITDQIDKAATRHTAKQATKPNLLDRLRGKGKAPLKVGAAITKPVKLRNGKFRYMGKEVSLKPHEIDEVTKKMKGNRVKAIEKLCHKKWSTPRMISEGPKGRLYRFRGGEFVLSPAEYKGANVKLIAQICEAKYAESLKITGFRTVKGAAEVKINGKWIKSPKGPGALAKARADYAKTAREAGYALPYQDLRNTRLLKYWPALKKSAGPAIAVAIIYHLETADDKRQAAAETGVTLAALWSGAKIGERATRSWTPTSVIGGMGKSGVIFFTALITAAGVTEPVSDILDEMIPKFVGQQQVSLGLIDVFEAYTARSLALKTTRKLGTKAGMEILKKKGLITVGKLLGKKIESTVLKKIITFSSKGLMGKIIVSLGARGAVLAVLVADDATVIGVIDDVVAVGMAAWMAKDIYDVAVLASRAIKIKDTMEEFNKMPIANVEPARVVDKKALEAALAVKGVNLEDLRNDEIMEVIKSIPDIRIKITREGSTGYEEYRFVKGEVFSTKIKTKTGEILELSDEELNQEIALPPPKEFQTWEIDYSQPKEKLEANYRMAILYTKSECGWTKLDFEIEDDKSILVKRLDGSASTTISRSGDKWSVEGYSEGHDLFQALVLANLVNKVHVIFEKEEHYGGSDQPFSMDDQDIDFDKTWNPNDLRILAAETNWLAFYDKVGVSKQDVVDTLNAWYKLEYKPLADKR